MDAQTLFRQGVLALRDQHDVARARKLLTESLRLNPDNEMAWLWLSRTTNDPAKKRTFVERALKLNPDNETARALHARLSAPAAPDTSLGGLRQAVTAAPAAIDPQTIDARLAEADRRLAANDAEGAIEQWVRVLELQPDQPLAIQNAVRHLFRLGYKDDAWELLQRGIDSGTTSVAIYLTAIDLALLRHEQGEADALRERVALLPGADDDLILKIVDQFVETAQAMRAVDLLEKALERRPDSQPLLLRMGDLQEHALGKKAQAMLYYDRASRGGGKSRGAAEKALRNFTPVISDRERGSVALALREAIGFGAVYLLLGWQDAGLNLLNMGTMRWLGVALSVVGGYLLVTALSSPQQKPLAAWLGGRVPKTPPLKPQTAPIMLDAEPTNSGPVQEPTHIPIIPIWLRAAFALVGAVVLAGAFMLVFSVSLQLLRHPVQPYVPSIEDLLLELE